MRDASERGVTALLVAVACAIMLMTMGRAVAGLAIALAVSYVLAFRLGTRPDPRRVVPVLAAAIVVQCFHFFEEYRAGFYRAFPPVFGADPWSPRQFAIFNLAWLVLFVFAAGVIARWRVGTVIALFLALGGGVGNALGHVALAVRAGGYFPGLYTAPLALVAGTVLAVVLLGDPASS